MLKSSQKFHVKYLNTFHMKHILSISHETKPETGRKE